MLSETVKSWLIGSMGNGGEYAYKEIYWYTLAAVVLAFGIAVVLGGSKRLTQKTKRKILVGICVFQLGFEVLWRVIFVLVRHDSVISCWPTYPCNLGGILIPILALTDTKRGKQLFYLFGFIGGVLTFAMPDGIFCSDVMTFPILKSILQHTGLLLIPGFEYANRSYRSSLRDLGWTICGALVHVVNCEVISRMLGFTEDYMFFRSGLPFVIPGVPQYITLSVFAIIVFAILSFLCNTDDSIRFIRELRIVGKKKKHVSI